MTFEPKEHGTSIATLVLLCPQLIEIHDDPRIVFNGQAVAKVQATRRELMGDRAYAMLTIITEDVDFHLNAIGIDQVAPDRKADQLLASAIVAHTDMIKNLTNLYLSYFPQLQQIFVTDDEQAAGHGWNSS